MRHRKQGRALSRNPSHRRAMLANIATSVLEQERIQTTTAKAKEARRLVERLITFGKRNDLHARRQALRIIRKDSVVAKLFSTLADRYSDRAGGYTRIIHVGYRQGDASEMSILELVGREGAVDVQAVEPEEVQTTKKPQRSSKAAEASIEEVVVEEVTEAPVEEGEVTEAPVAEESEVAEAPVVEEAEVEESTEVELPKAEAKPKKPDQKAGSSGHKE